MISLFEPKKCLWSRIDFTYRFCNKFVLKKKCFNLLLYLNTLFASQYTDENVICYKE